MLIILLALNTCFPRIPTCIVKLIKTLVNRMSWEWHPLSLTLWSNDFLFMWNIPCLPWLPLSFIHCDLLTCRVICTCYHVCIIALGPGKQFASPSSYSLLWTTVVCFWDWCILLKFRSLEAVAWFLLALKLVSMLARSVYGMDSSNIL